MKAETAAEAANGYVNHPPKDLASMHDSESPDSKRNDFIRRARAMISGFPSSLDAQMKRRPYATVGVACAVGLGVGILVGSRILRSVLVSTVSYAAVELGRAYLRQREAPAADPRPTGTANAA